jgi:hypothetical protein
MDERQTAPAAERNKEPILTVLRRVLLLEEVIEMPTNNLSVVLRRS